LSQLSRKIEERQDKRPKLSDLRESGALEQDADKVSFIYNKNHYSTEEGAKNEAANVEIITEKNRNGGVGISVLKFTPKTTMFEETTELNEEFNKDIMTEQMY